MRHRFGGTRGLPLCCHHIIMQGRVSLRMPSSFLNTNRNRLRMANVTTDLRPTHTATFFRVLGCLASTICAQGRAIVLWEAFLVLFSFSLPQNLVIVAQAYNVQKWGVVVTESVHIGKHWQSGHVGKWKHGQSPHLKRWHAAQWLSLMSLMKLQQDTSKVPSPACL